MSEEKRECDLDDIMCQMQVLGHLKGMRSVLGEERFKSNFPELEGLDERLADRIKGQDASLKEALEKCGLPALGESEIEPQIEEEESGEQTGD